MDLTRTMKDSRQTLIEAARDIVNQIKILTSDFRIAMGSFSDKNVVPFSTGRPPKSQEFDWSHAFTHHVNMTNDTSTFIKALERTKVRICI